MHEEIKHLDLSALLKTAPSRSSPRHNAERACSDPPFGSFFYARHIEWDTACFQPLLRLHAWPAGTTAFHPMLDSAHKGLQTFVLITIARWEPGSSENTLSPVFLRCGRVSACLKRAWVSDSGPDEVDISCVQRSKTPGTAGTFELASYRLLNCLWELSLFYFFAVCSYFGKCSIVLIRWHRATDSHKGN